jgi:hypothetical protein
VSAESFNYFSAEAIMCITGKIKNVSLACDGIYFTLISRDEEEVQHDLFIEDCSELDILQISDKEGFSVTCLVENSICRELYI